MQITILSIDAIILATWLAACSQKLSPSEQQTELTAQAVRKPCNTGSVLTEEQAGRQAGTHFLLLLLSSGHTVFVTLWFSLQEIVTKDEDKKTITCPEQLISVSCIYVSAKILPYTETVSRGLGKLIPESFVSTLNIKVGHAHKCRLT